MRGWILLGCQFGGKEVHVAEIRSCDASGVVVRYPRSPEGTFYDHDTFAEKFRREISRPRCLPAED